MSKSRARLLAELLNSAGRVKKDKSDLAGADSIIDLDTIPTITNAKLENSSISIADHSVSLGGSVTLNTGDIGEHTNYKYYTDARARAAISVSGSTISYDSSTGVITSTANNYSLPTATPSAIGGVKIGYTESGKNYPVELSNGQMYVNVPWVDTNTTYSVGDGGLTQNNFTTALKNKLDGIAASANNYVLPFTDNSSNWNTAYGWGNHASAGYLTSHQSLAAYAPLASPAFTGTPTAPTASAGTNTTQIATTAFVGTAVSNLVDSAPGTLNTLNELAAALGDDANFSTTVTNSIATKLPLAGGTVTGAGTTALTVTNTSGNGGYFNVNSNVGAVSTDGSVGLHIGWNKSNGGREINMIFDGGTSQADTEMIFTSTDGSTYTDIFQINGGGNVDIKSGGLRIGTTTVINSSRQISSAQIHNTGVIYLGSTATANDQLATNNGTDIFIGTSAKGLRTYKDLHTNSGNNKYWHAGNDGPSSGLNADLLDSLDSNDFMRLDGGSPGHQAVPANRIKRFYSNDALDTTSGSQSSLEVFQDTAGADAFMTFHVSGDYAAYFGLDGGTNDLAFGGWSRGAASYKVWHAGNDGSTSGLDADTLDSYHASTTRNSANTIPVRDGNGYLNVGWINTTSGATSDATVNFYTDTGDNYIRKKSLANVRTEIMGVASGNSFLRSDANDTATGRLTLQYGVTSDFNNIGGTQGVTAFYAANVGGVSNRPDTGNYATGLEFVYHDTSARSQLAAGSGGNNNQANFYVRSEGWSGANGWTSWYKLFHTGNDGSSSGLDADTLDGQQGQYYKHPTSPQSTNVSFDSFSGVSGYYNSVQFFNLYTPTSGTQSTYNSPTNVGAHHHVMQFNGYSPTINNWKYQSAFSFYTGDMYTRNMYSTTWQSWARQWSSLNDGSSSGLDADTVDGIQGASFLRSDASDSGAGSAANYLTLGYLHNTKMLIGAGSTSFTDHYNDSPWYGIGRTNVSGWHTSSGNTKAQMAFYWGLVLRSGQSRIELGPASNGPIQFGDGGTNNWAKINSTGIYQGTSNLVWHAGNDGPDSGLDADTLDGQHGSYYAPAAGSSSFRPVTGGLYGTGHGSSMLPIWQYNSSHPGYGFGYVEGSSDSFRFDVSNNLVSGTPDFEISENVAKVNGNAVWHAGNDDFLMHYKGIVSGNWDTIFSQTDGHMGVYEVQNITNTDSNYPSGAYSYGGVLSWQLDNSTFKMYAPHTGSLYIQNGWNNDEYSGWREVWDSGNDGGSSGLDADLLDGQHGAYYQNAGNLNAGTIPEARLPTISKYLRSDTADTGSGKITLTATEGLEVGGIRGRAIGDQSGDFIQLYERVSIGYPSGWGASAAGAPAYGLSTHGGAQFNKGNVSGAPFTFNGHTIWHAGNDGPGSGLNADNLDGYSKAEINPAHSHYRWTGISASGTQARRFVIMRLYGTPAHWDSNWQDIHLKVWSESYEATNLKYEICGDYNGGNQNTMFQLRLKDAGGSSEHGRFRLVLGTPVDAGWDHSGQNTYYVDVYAEAAHYMQFTVAADFYSAGFNVNTLPTSGGATTVVYSSPSVSNITTFNEAKEHSYFANHKIWNDGNHGSASGLDADLLDGEHGSSFLRSNANDTATGVIVFDQATQYFRKNNATNYTNGSLMVESYGGSSSIAAMGFHISGQLGRMLSMNSAGTLNWEDDVSISGSYFTPNTSANGLKSANGNNFFLPLDSYNNMHIRSTTGSEYHDSTAYYFRKVDQSDLLTITASNTNIAAGTLTRGGNTVWDAGNDGSGSGLDADTVDGMQYVTHLGLGKRQTITVYGDTDKYYPMIISGNAGHISTYKIHRGYSEHGPNDWNTSSHKGGLSFMYNIMGASGWGGYPTRVHVIEAGEIYSSLLGGILHHAHTMKHVVWLRGGGSGGGRYHIDSNSDFTVEVSSLSTDSHYKNSTDGWYTYNHSNDTYDQTVNYRTLTERNTAMQNEIFANMDVNYSTGTISHQLHGAPTPNKTYIHTGNMGTDCNADQLDGYHASDFPRLNTTNTFGTNHINYFGVARGTTSGSLNTGNLQVYASGTNSAFMSFHRGGSYAVNMGLDSDNVLRIGGWSASANRWVLDMSGNMTAAGNITAYSDIRLKENIEVIPNALEKVNQIRGVTFTRNDQDDKEARHTGVIAQEVEKVLPEVVAEDDLGIKNVAYGNMVGLLIEAVKELKQEVEDLKTQLKER